MSNVAKISVSLSKSLVANLDYLSARLGVSRSAMISEILEDSISDMRRLLELVPPNPTPADVLRLRGASEEVIRTRLGSLKGLGNDLFSE